jgi:type IV secretion system protein VirD4
MKARAGMYRTPRDPGGFPFGYNWKATGIGLVLLVGFNLLATQYIAAQFHYQPALGTPLLRMKRTALYQPFAWCIWGFQNCTSRDNRVTKPLFEGEMIVLGGCILSMVAFFVAANRRARRLSENAEDLHGSARLAAPEDIEATRIMRN